MEDVLTTKMSSRGQVVIPEPIRAAYGLDDGTAFVVLAYNGSIIMEPIRAPTQHEIERRYRGATSRKRTAKRVAAKNDVVAFFRKSPLVGSGIDLSRDKDTGRTIQL